MWPCATTSRCPRTGPTPSPRRWWDCVATLSYLAAVTHRVRLLSHVYVLPFRHPLVAAKQWMTLDALSGGRAILGVGAGHLEGEFAALGVDPAAAARCWTSRSTPCGPPSPASTRRTRATPGPTTEVGQAPRPVQDRVPIWVGGSSPAALRRAAERGDGWLPAGPPEGGHVGRHRPPARAARAGRSGRTSRSPSARCRARCTWACPAGTSAGPCTARPSRSPSFLRVLAGLGVDQIQVAFRSRDVHELYDQLRAFGAEVAPLVGLATVR